MNYDNDTCLFQTLRYLTRTNAEVSTIKKREIFSNLASTEIYDIHPAAVTPTSSISDQTKLPLDSRLATTLNSRYMLKTSTAG